MKKIIKVEGMSCGHCVMRVEKAIGKVNGVSKVVVSLTDKTAEVEGESLDMTTLIKAVVASGYTAKE